MGLFKSLANFVKDNAEDFAKIKKETYEQIQTEHWYDIYRMLKSKGASSVVSAKGLTATGSAFFPAVFSYSFTQDLIY